MKRWFILSVLIGGLLGWNAPADAAKPKSKKQRALLAKKKAQKKAKKKALKKLRKAKKSKRIKLLVLDFEEQGKIAKGAGKTLAMLLYSSLNPRKYYVMDPNRLRSLMNKYKWSATQDLSPDFLGKLKKEGVGIILTGTVGHQYGTFTANYRIVSMDGRIMFSEVLPPVQSWVGLVSGLRYSVKTLLRKTTSSRTRSSSRLARRIKLLRKRMRRKKKKSSLKPFKAVAKGYKRMKGLFPLYIKKYRGQKYIMMEVSPKQLGQLFMFSPTLEGGTGGSLITFAQLREFPFYLKRQGNRIFLMEKNVRFRVNPKAAVARVFKKSFTDSIHATTIVKSDLHPKRKTFLVDFNALFFKNLAGLASWIRVGSRYYRRRLAFNRALSEFSMIKNFPNNLELGLSAVFRNMPSIAVPPGYGMKILLRYSISRPPNTGYRPRIADDRVGHFLMIAKDYTHDNVNTRYIRYITRWHLEKKFPERKISVPKKPITYWMHNAIPYRYRKAVRKGILVWNNAFEKIGFRGAVRARQQPKNAKFDLADTRYASVRWFLANSAGFAQGPSRIHPLTGQIYDADIRVSADMTMFLSQQFRLTVTPVRSWDAYGGFDLFSNPAKKMNIVQSLARTLKHYDTLKERLAQKRREHQHKHAHDCNYGYGAMQQAALGWHLLQLRGMLPNPKLEKKFVDDFLIGVIAHEVGHTLGLRHNFKASTLHSYKDLHDKKKTIAMGLTNSMMEYTPVNLALPGEKQGQYWQTTLGPYDYWSIEYAYKPLPKARTPQAELPELNKIASKVAQHKLAYATDEDSFGILSPDPDALRWDLGKDSLFYFKTRAKLAKEMWDRIEKKFGSPKYTYQLMRRAFGVGLGTYIRAGINAAGYIGGLYHRRDHIGDPGKRLPFKPVAAKKQREALAFLVKKYFSKGSVKWSASLLNKLAPNRFWDFTFSVWGMRVDYPIHRAVMMSQAYPMFRIFHPLVLDRIQDTKLRLKPGESYLSIDELFRSVSNAVWAELNPGPTSKNAKGTKTSKVAVDSFRRNLQWYHLRILGLYARVRLMSLSDPSNVARLLLKELKGKIEKALPHSSGMTRAHLDRSLSRIKLLLKPTMVTF
ncbi:MAG: DUF5117 domain-containing protein [Deltaproteobacteria bacterium]|nr:MAG: DUF5117 domain-containing protein [Deltaproteobacteria bacterium]